MRRWDEKKSARNETERERERANRILFSSYSWLTPWFFYFVLNLLIFPSFLSFSHIFLSFSYFLLSSFEKILNQRLSEFEKKNNLRIVFLAALTRLTLTYHKCSFLSSFSPRSPSSPLSHLLYVLNFSLSFIPVIFCVSQNLEEKNGERKNFFSSSVLLFSLSLK